MCAVLHFFEGFWTWNTPVSFLAGVGAMSILRHFTPAVVIETDDRNDDVQEE